MPVNRNRSFGGGGRSYGGRSFGGGTMSLGFPPFTRVIKWLIIINASIYLLMLIVGGVAPQVAGFIQGYGGLVPAAVTQGWIWQLVTYLFLHSGLFHILFNMLTLWMFGSALESTWGDKQFLEFYFFCGIGAAFVTIAVAYAALFPTLQFLGLSPLTLTIGASGAIYGVMVAFAMLYGDQEFMMFPLPFTIRAKYLVAILIFISLAQALGGSRGQTVAQFAHLGGAFFGWIYIRFLPRRGLRFLASERYYGIRNSYYRWKRRRAARKFQVYMRKQDRSQFFDEYGNYRGHEDDPKKGNGESRGPWVN
ncbi:MAG TPA: rhomboid family intramembrane serine protease [Terriglobales bacterium]|nr:rhomboid family intramembrane serine protease [Terriglobales bacterium]